MWGGEFLRARMVATLVGMAAVPKDAARAQKVEARDQAIRSTLLLRPGEAVPRILGATILRAYKGKDRNEAGGFGFLLLTDQRLVFVEKVGLTNRYRAKESIDLENLINVSVQRRPERLYVTDQAGGKSVEMMFSRMIGDDLLEVQREIQETRTARVDAVEREKKQARVQYLLDFSFLKAQLDKGGITVTALRCPNCAGSLEIPAGGTSTKCSHCGSTIVAQDVFDRMKGLIGGLP